MIFTDYKVIGKEEGFKALEYYIIFNELCTGCGMCQAICPENAIDYDEYPYLKDKCTKCGYCLEACPRTNIDRKELEKKIFGEYANDLLGSYKKVFAMKTNVKGQDGGAVTYILKRLLEEKFIDAAIVTFHKNQKAYPEIVSDPNRLLLSSGTKYTMSNSLKLLKDSLKYKNVAIVALPCQVEAIRKFQYEKVGDIDLTRSIRLIIGLFCKSNFLHSLFTDLIAEKYSINLESIEKVDIKGKYLYIYLKEDKKYKIPLKEILQYKRYGCNYCIDFTARMADISIGSIGSKEGFSTVIVRTDMGLSAIERILNDKDVEISDNIDFDSIHKLAKTKFTESMKEIKRKIIENLPFYLKQYGDLL